MTHESTAAWKELLATIGDLDRSFLEGDRAVSDDRHVADGYRLLAATLGGARTPVSCPTAPACPPPHSVWRWTPTCFPNPVDPSSSRSTPRSVAIAVGA